MPYNLWVGIISKRICEKTKIFVMTWKIVVFFPGSGSGLGKLPGSGSGLKRIRIRNTAFWDSLVFQRFAFSKPLNLKFSEIAHCSSLL